MSVTPTPPRLAADLLSRALKSDRARAAILGDLHEDFTRRVAEPERAAESNNTDIESYAPPPEGPAEYVDFDQSLMSDYFETLGIPIVAGRGFEPADVASDGIVVVINEAMARKFWPGQDPVGQRLRRAYASLEWYTVIGVARDVKQGGVHEDAGSELFFFVEHPSSTGGSRTR
jgi:hypothetical protein